MFGAESTPIVADGVMYVSSSQADTQLYALDAATGAKLWTFSFFKGYPSSPVVANGRCARRRTMWAAMRPAKRSSPNSRNTRDSVFSS